MFFEITSALFSSTLVSPVMTIIDTSIIKSQIFHFTFKQSIINTTKMYVNGSIKFIPPFKVMNMVYASTYLTANLTEHICKKNEIDYKIPTLLATSAVNIASITYKDIYYSKIFQTTYRPVPLKSFILFASRDTMTILSSFILKTDFANHIEKKFNIPHNMADLIASFTLPITAQIFSTPLHILSIDLYQNPTLSWKERLLHIKRIYVSVCIGRMFRVVPAFCIGGYINDTLRSRS